MIETLDHFRNPSPVERFDAGDEPVGWQSAFPDILLDGEHRDLRRDQPGEVLVEPGGCATRLLPNASPAAS